MGARLARPTQGTMGARVHDGPGRGQVGYRLLGSPLRLTSSRNPIVEKPANPRSFQVHLTSGRPPSIATNCAPNVRLCSGRVFVCD